MGDCHNPVQPHRITHLSRKQLLNSCAACEGETAWGLLKSFAMLLTVAMGIAISSAMMSAEHVASNRSPAQTFTTPDLETMLASMVRAYAESRSQLRPYVLTRQYVVLSSGQQKSNIIVAIIYLPPEATTFVIRESTGGKAERVVRRLIEKEMQIARNFQVVGFNIANYEFKSFRRRTSGRVTVLCFGNPS